jgi:prepilin-type N-terminal cleavage/methylation domain-containing protein
MQIKQIRQTTARRAYTFVEVMMAVAVVGVMTVSLYAGISASFGVIQRTRENLRATQILVQRAETVRLYSWDQLTNNATPRWFQTNFTEVYDPLSVTNGTGIGISYHGNIALSVPPPVSVLPANVSYRGNVALVSITLRWTNAAGANPIPHVRTYQTLVAKSGMQRYVFGKQ